MTTMLPAALEAGTALALRMSVLALTTTVLRELSRISLPLPGVVSGSS
jgi:hypothetical protein